MFGPDIEALLSRSMTRREFIKYLGLVLVTLVGLQHIFRVVSNPQLLGIPKTTRTFSTGPYGG